MKIGQRGFTLPEVLIGAALLGGVALVTAKLMSDQATQQAYITTQAEMGKTVSEIESYLNNPTLCKQMLGGKIVAPVGSAGVPVSTLKINTVMGGSQSKTVIAEGNYPRFIIETNAMVLKQSPNASTIANLEITFLMKTRSAQFRSVLEGAEHKVRIMKSIPVVVQLNGANAIDECGPVLSDVNSTAQEKMCASLGATVASWDTTNRRCVLRSVKCDYGYVAIKMTSLGGIICVPVRDRLNLGDYFEFGAQTCPVGSTISLETAPAPSNKIRVKCN